MAKKINLSGKWLYKEDFGFGVDTGYAILNFEENKISGFLTYSEQISGDATYMIKQKVSGNFDGLNIKIEGLHVETLPIEESDSYSFDTWEGYLENPKRIVGNSIDESGIEGNFIFEKLHNNNE